MILETERLVLRNWLESDVDCYMTLSHDVGYNCFSMPGRFLVRTANEAKERILDRMNLFREHRLGKFPVFLKDTGKFIGTCGVAPFQLAGRTEVEMGYRLCLEYWGQGYATEAAAAALRYGFGDLGLKKIMAFALPQNVASLHVLDKLGARYLHDFIYAGLTHRLYDLHRDKFVA